MFLQFWHKLYYDSLIAKFIYSHCQSSQLVIGIHLFYSVLVYLCFEQYYSYYSNFHKNKDVSTMISILELMYFLVGFKYYFHSLYYIRIIKSSPKQYHQDYVYSNTANIDKDIIVLASATNHILFFVGNMSIPIYGVDDVIVPY